MGGTGCQLAPGRASPAAAVVAAPVVEWPLRVVDDHDRALSLGAALGPGGDQVEGLLGAVIGVGDGDAVDVPALARSTPAGHVGLPLAVVPLAEGVEVADRVDREWLAAVDRRRAGGRQALVAAGRNPEMEAALHVTLLVATERFDPSDHADVDAHVASGARLWLLAGAVVSALAGGPDPFGPWGRLVAAGWWPVGPSGGRLVVSASAPVVGR